MINFKHYFCSISECLYYSHSDKTYIYSGQNSLLDTCVGSPDVGTYVSGLPGLLCATDYSKTD